MKAPHLPSGRWLVWILFLFVSAVSLRAAPPVVSNVRSSQRTGTGLVDIYYDVSDADNNKLAITVQVSNNGGVSYTDGARSASGDIGLNIPPGSNKHIIWDAGADWDPIYFPNVRVKVIANDGLENAPTEMAYVPESTFMMGDAYGEGSTTERPVHSVYVAAFFIDKFEVSKQLWDQVCLWAAAHGYAFDQSAMGTAADHPAHTINWYDAVKWCNARSEMRGLTPVYYTNSNQTTLYKTGRIDLQNTFVKWSANGYRLPTEGEWEKAARGGLPAAHFPWQPSQGNYALDINGSKANYSGSGDPFEGSSPATTPVGYYNGKQVPAGGDMANGYGIYDMAGNVWEWCWDWYSDTWYGQAGATQANTRGPTSGQYRVLRGGSWVNDSNYLRCAYRNGVTSDFAYNFDGFRCVRGL